MQFGFSLFIIWLSHFILDFMLGVWPVYKRLAELDLVLAGLMASVASLIGEGSQLYFGILSDRGWQRKLISLGVILTAAIPFIVYVSNIWVLFICLLFVYIGSGAFHPSASRFIMTSMSPYKSLLIALFSCGGMLGAAFSQCTFIYFYNHFNGHTWMLVIPILILFVFCFLNMFGKGVQVIKRLSFKEVFEDLKPYRLQLGCLYVITVCFQFVVGAFSFLLPEILGAKGQADTLCLGGGYFFFILGSAVTSVPLGYFVGRIGYKPILAGIVIGSILLLNIFLVVESLSTKSISVLLILLGGTMGVIGPIVVAGSNSIVPRHTSGLVSAMFMGGVACVTGFAPVLSSLLTSYVTKTPIVTLQALSGLFIVSIGLVGFLSLLLEDVPQCNVNAG